MTALSRPDGELKQNSVFVPLKVNPKQSECHLQNVKKAASLGLTQRSILTLQKVVFILQINAFLRCFSTRPIKF